MPGLTDLLLGALLGMGQECLLCLQHLFWAAAGCVLVQELTVQV